MTLEHIIIEGYQSICELNLELQLRSLDVLICANGAGKMSLISGFQLLNEML